MSMVVDLVVVPSCGAPCARRAWCVQCSPGAGCSPVTKFTKWKVSQYGGVSGANNMKAEIYARGPIGCGIDATDQLEAYKGGVFSQKSLFPMINHEISVVGWGVDNGTVSREKEHERGDQLDHAVDLLSVAYPARSLTHASAVGCCFTQEYWMVFESEHVKYAGTY